MTDEIQQVQARLDECQRQLSEYTRRYHRLVENNVDGLVVVNAAGVVLFANPAAQRLFDRPLSELVGHELGYPLVAGEPAEIDVLRRNSPAVTVELRVAPTEWDGSFALLATLRDVTERKELEEAIRRAQRLEMAGRVASQVAHDFNNLLQPLVGYPALIKRRLPEGHPAVEYCDAMIRLAHQLAKINEDLLTLGRRGHVERVTLQLNDIVRQMVADLGGDGKLDRLRVSLADDLPAVSGAEAQLLRVVTNLVANALDATAERGEVEVSTEHLSIERAISRFATVPVGAYVRLRIRDTGAGIPPEIRHQIFDAFFTTKRADVQRGSGLGLTIVQTVLEDHGAILDFASEVGRGTTFDVYFRSDALDERRDRVGTLLARSDPAIAEPPPRPG